MLQIEEVDVIIDCHTHAFPKQIREHRDKYFPTEPAFKILYETPKAKLVSVEETVATMDEQKVNKSIIFGFPWEDSDTCRRNNDYIIESVNKYPERLIGFSCLDPFSADAAKEVERCLEAGLSGVGELAFYRSGINELCLDCLAPIMALCQEANVPVMIHTNEPVGHLYPGKTPNTLAQIYQMVKRFSSNTFILAHWGGGIFFYNLLKKEVRDILTNVYFDTAASPFLYRPEVYGYAKNLVGIDKILLGTDFPLLKPERYFKEMDTAGLSEAEKQQICGDNVASLLGL
jgi:predicted TIM-barrel fold metal-dependent hydrolase